MSVVVDFTVPAEEFPLGGVLQAGPSVEARLESMVPVDGSTIPYLRVNTAAARAVVAALDDSELVEEVRRVGESGDETRIRVQWSEKLDGVLEAIRRSDAVVLEGASRENRWSFTCRFPSPESLSAFYRDTSAQGLSITLDRVDTVADSTALEGRLTPEQREAIAVALESGYFAVPRETTLVALGERLGISDTAVSQRIRRGLVRILSTLELSPRESDDEDEEG